ncbi:MAG: N-acetylmuramoyl-L-alanine amidase [Dehalococcoidia bacterium]
MRLFALALVYAIVFLTGCSSGDPGTDSSTRAPSNTATPTPTGELTGTRAATATPTPTPIPTPIPPTPSPTVSPTPIPIFHDPPYTVAIDAGHGGPYYSGASFRDADGNLWIEKGLTLDTALRLDVLLRQASYNTVLIRDGDYTLTPFAWDDYRGSMINETQARVDMANAAQADILVSLHFNGSTDSSLGGTETYYNPDRSFGYQSYGLAFYAQQKMLLAIADLGHDVRDRGLRNDAEVGGDPANDHSYLLGTNDYFRPSLMPGIIAEPLFLSNAADAAVIARDDARQRIAEAYREAIEAYFAWLPPTR